MQMSSCPAGAGFVFAVCRGGTLRSWANFYWVFVCSAIIAVVSLRVTR